MKNEEFVDRKEVINIFNNEFLKTCIVYEFSEIEEFLNTAKITITDKDIINFKNEIRKKENFNMDLDISKMNETDAFLYKFKKSKFEYNNKDLKYYKDCFNIYLNKAKKFCEIVHMIIGDLPVDEALFKKLDIVITNKQVRKSDIFRVFKPLYANYVLADVLQFKAQELSTYFITALPQELTTAYEDYLPSKALLNALSETCREMNAKEAECFMPLTKKLKEEENKRLQVKNNWLTDVIKNL